MPIRVLVVDDSSFFRRRVSEILTSDRNIEVIDTAINGKEAVEKAIQLRPDVITMDIEMPVMNGIAAVREIMLAKPVPILMFSSLTHDGAKATLDALDAGALDFLPKRFDDIAKDRNEAVNTLLERVKALANRRGLSLIKARQLRQGSQPGATPAKPEPAKPEPIRGEHSASVAPARRRHRSTPYKLVAIGCSTGGPVALQQILSRLPASFPLPIVLIQHMPGTFTAAFAQRLDGLCAIRVHEASNGDRLLPGHAYLAPGGQQMLLEGSSGAMRLKINPGPPNMVYKPSVDITFASAAKITGDVLAVILTGMGADGRDGSRLLKGQGATLFAQDEASCVVYGMPQAVTAAGLTDESISLDRIAGRILAEIGHG